MQNCDIYIKIKKKLFACCTCSDYASTIPLDLCFSFFCLVSFLSNLLEKIILELKRYIQIYDENAFNFQ